MTVGGRRGAYVCTKRMSYVYTKVATPLGTVPLLAPPPPLSLPSSHSIPINHPTTCRPLIRAQWIVKDSVHVSPSSSVPGHYSLWDYVQSSKPHPLPHPRCCTTQHKSIPLTPLPLPNRYNTQNKYSPLNHTPCPTPITKHTSPMLSTTPPAPPPSLPPTTRSPYSLHKQAGVCMC